MKLIKTELKDCYIIKPNVFGDDRGYFSPYFIQKEFNDLDFKKVVQINRSKSEKGVLRGLHFQKEPKAQGKIVEVINGAAIDIIVDLRIDSPSYGKSLYIFLSPYDEINEESGRQLFIPRGFAHGYLSLEDNTIFQYLTDNDYAPEMEDGIFWNDPLLNIPWQEIFNKYDIKELKLSEKDKNRLTLKESPTFFGVKK